MHMVSRYRTLQNLNLVRPANFSHQLTQTNPNLTTRIAFRYFVIQTKWYFRSKRLCELVRYFSIPRS